MKEKYQFLWANPDIKVPDDYPDKFYWHGRTYVGTLAQACDKMLHWLEGRPYDAIIDYEVRAEHLMRTRRKYDQKYIDISDMAHPLTDYIQ